MLLKSIYQQLFILGIAGLSTMSILTGCVYSSAAIYREPPPGVVKYGSGRLPADPDDYAVNPSNYPAYQAGQAFLPPAPPDCTANWKDSDRSCTSMPRAKILPTDVWHVTHVFNGRYMIESNDFYKREEKLLEEDGYLSNQYSFAIYIFPNGEVSGGWQILPGFTKGGPARYTYLSYAPRKNEGWPSGKVFEKVPAGPVPGG